MNKNEGQVAQKLRLEAITGQRASRVNELIQWVNCNSGSRHRDGLIQMKTILQKSFSRIPGECTEVFLPAVEELALNGVKTVFETGPVIHITHNLNAARKILLCGHYDTVFGVDHAFQSAQFLTENRLNGPGVNDMKGGLMVMLMALECLSQTDVFSRFGYEIILNPDEEIGSMASAPFIESRAANHDYALVFEPALDEKGTLASARKGSAKYTLIATGVSAHAGRDFARGRNAITALARCVAKIDELNRNDRGVTINVGLMRGGEALNIVPDKAVCKIDCRVENNRDAQWLLDNLNRVIHDQQLKEDVQFLLKCESQRPAKLFDAKQQQFFEQLKLSASALSQDVSWMPSGGCTDGNNLAAQGVAVIDSMGTCGGNIHQDSEYILIDSLVSRAQLCAKFLWDFANGDTR